MALPESEQELLSAVLKDEPIEPQADTSVEVEVEVDKPSEDDGERKRDEKGRFVSAEKPEQEAQATEEPQAQQPQTAPQQQEQRQERGDSIPSWRLKEESDARREWQAKAEQAARDAETARLEAVQFRQRLAAMERQFQEKANPPPDMYSDPDGWQRHQAQTFQQSNRETLFATSEMVARVKFGDELVEKADAELTRVLNMNPNDPIAAVIGNSRNPAFEMVKWFQQQEANKRLAGKSIDDLLKEEGEKLLNDPAFLAKAIEKAKATAKPVQPTATNVNIPSLNRATAAAGSHKSEEADMTDAGLLRSALRG